MLSALACVLCCASARAQDLVWAHRAGGVGLDLGSNVAIDATGNCYVVGVFEGSATFGSGANATTLTSVGTATIFLAKYSGVGELLWARQTGVTSPAEAWSEIAVDSSGIYLTSPFVDSVTLGVGETNQTTLAGVGSEDFLVAKYSPDGLLMWAKQAGGVERDRGTVPYTLSRAAHIRLVVYDMMGRAVRVLVDGLTSAGRHSVVFDADNLSTGVYVYRLESESSGKAGRMLLVK